MCNNIFAKWHPQHFLFRLLKAYNAIVLNSFCDQIMSEMISI